MKQLLTSFFCPKCEGGDSPLDPQCKKEDKCKYGCITGPGIRKLDEVKKDDPHAAVHKFAKEKGNCSCTPDKQGDCHYSKDTVKKDDKNEVLKLIGEIDFIDIDSRGYVIMRVVCPNNSISRIQTHSGYVQNTSIQYPQALSYLMSLKGRQLYKIKTTEFVII